MKLPYSHNLKDWLHSSTLFYLMQGLVFWNRTSFMLISFHASSANASAQSLAIKFGRKFLIETELLWWLVSRRVLSSLNELSDISMNVLNSSFNFVNGVSGDCKSKQTLTSSRSSLFKNSLNHLLTSASMPYE